MSSDPDGLSQLLDRVARKDVTAFRQLYDAVLPRLSVAARAVTRDGSLSEDVLQLTFVRIWERAGSYQPSGGSALGWMIRICRNIALDELRKSKAELQRVARAHEISRQTGPDAPLFSLFEDHLDHLPSDQVAALVAIYVEGLTHAELAARSGLPLGTIKSRVRRALLSVRRSDQGRAS